MRQPKPHLVRPNGEFIVTREEAEIVKHYPPLTDAQKRGLREDRNSRSRETGTGDSAYVLSSVVRMVARAETAATTIGAVVAASSNSRLAYECAASSVVGALVASGSVAVAGLTYFWKRRNEPLFVSEAIQPSNSDTEIQVVPTNGELLEVD